MTNTWDSLQLRIALATAFLMIVGVAVTVIQAVSEVQQRTAQSISDTNLGVAYLARSLSVRVIERQRALSAAARDWPAEAAAHSPQADAFLANQGVLRSLFDRVAVAGDPQSLGIPKDTRQATAPMGDFTPKGTQDILIGVPLPARRAPGAWLIGMVSPRSSNFLSDAARREAFGDIALETVIADQQGRILADSDATALLTRVDDDARLRSTVARWRRQGAPLEPAPWTELIDGYFVAMAAVPGTDWMVFRVASSEALLGKASGAILRTTAIGALVAIAGALSIFAVTAWLLQPVTALQQRALRVLDPGQAADLDWPTGGGEVGRLSEVLRHVSQQMAAGRSDMERSLRRMQAVLEFAPTGVAFAKDGRFELVSRAFETIFGYGRGGLQGSSWERLAPSSTASESLRESARHAFRQGLGFDTEIQLRRRDGSLLWAQVNGAVVRDDDTVSHTIWIVADTTHSRKRREDLEWSAAHDPLTRLANRRVFEQRLQSLLGDRRHGGSSSALFIDLDYFKQVNDSAGHAAGDTLLKRISSILEDQVREEDIVARLGGDEFAVLLNQCGLEQAMRIAEKIRGEVESAGKVEGARRGVTASIGVVEVAGTGHTLASILEAADKACYVAKRDGRNLVRAATSSGLKGETSH